MIHRFFLVAEGENSGYPNYQSATISFSIDDPCQLAVKHNFLTSPVFSVSKEGVVSLPTLKDGTSITFIVAPNIFPTLNTIIRKFCITDELWFTLGLANLLLIENDNSGITSKILKELEGESNVVASETWVIKSSKIDKHYFPNSVTRHEEIDFHQIKLVVSDCLPLHLKFNVSEFIIYSNKLLTASKKFTPQYFDKHLKTIEASVDLINDLSFLYGDFTFSPSESLLNSLGLSIEDVKLKVAKGEKLDQRDELIKDRNGRLVQFNSSISYVFSQCYSGTFPLFDHTGIIQRHSLLGIGTAISTLFELLVQLETVLFLLPYEHLEDAGYKRTNIPEVSFFKSFIEVSLHDKAIWERDKQRFYSVASIEESKIHLPLPDDFFHRLAFYSGRLGFREYDLSATAAIQVLVEANSLQWHIINYTHEVIHNHVRIILNQLLVMPMSLRQGKYQDWLEHYLDLMEKCISSTLKSKCPTDISYYDYFILVLIKYCINFKYYGSLSRESSQEEVLLFRTEVNRTKKYRLPSQKQLAELIKNLYKDITEIFVHIIDYSYIYTRNTQTYILSIWSSWSTVSAVSSDLKQYILRTLIVIGVNQTGSVETRFEKSKTVFLGLLDGISRKNENSYLFTSVRELLEKDSDEDLKYRFMNCIIVGDLVYSYFVGDIESALDASDENRVGDFHLAAGDMQFSYAVDEGSFEGSKIRSKVRMIKDQLVRAVIREDAVDSLSERNSAWLLLSLSSFN